MPELAVHNPAAPRVRVDLGELIHKFISLTPNCERCGKPAEGRVSGRRIRGAMYYTALCPRCAPPAGSAVETRRSPSPTNADIRKRLQARERQHRRF